MIILKENEWASQMIATHDIGKKPSETLRRIARYYIDQGCSTIEVRKNIELFVVQCDPNNLLPQWENLIEHSIKMATKYEAIDIDKIIISKEELDKIAQLDGRQEKRLAFTLLCLAKYWHIVKLYDTYWVNTKDTEIMALANIRTSTKNQAALYYKLRENGLIEYSKKVDNTNVKVTFITGGTPALYITDFRNLGFQYLRYYGEPYMECEGCGVLIKINHPDNKRRQKYCSECAEKNLARQKFEYVLRKRELRNNG